MNLKFIHVAAIPLFIILCSSAAPAQDYEIHLEQTSKVGDKYSLSATGSQHVRVKLTSGDQVIRNTNDGFAVELTAEATILAVDTRGQAISKSFTITSAKVIREGITKQLLPNGSIVLAKLQSGNTLFELNGRPVEGEVAKALSIVIALHSGDSISDEAMFGSQSRRRVGESWNLNIEAIMAFIQGLGGQAMRENITGTTVLEKVENNHLFVHGTMDVVNVLLPLSSDFNTEKGEVHSEFFTRLPLASSDGSIDRRNKVLMNLNGTSRHAPNTNEPVMRINTIIEIGNTFKIIPAIQK